jgi:hypothetical protein
VRGWHLARGERIYKPDTVQMARPKAKLVCSPRRLHSRGSASLRVPPLIRLMISSRNAIRLAFFNRRFLAHFLSLLLACSAYSAPLFEVVPPEKAPFIYPEPPLEGAPDYFQIARDGQPRCVIVRGPGAARGAAELLKAYLDLATGASFEIVDANKKIKPGWA